MAELSGVLPSSLMPTFWASSRICSISINTTAAISFAFILIVVLIVFIKIWLMVKSALLPVLCSKIKTYASLKAAFLGKEKLRFLESAFGQTSSIAFQAVA
jgi:hypothetical protein